MSNTSLSCKQMIARTFAAAFKPAFTLRAFGTAAYTLPPLPYARNALAPAISENTMKCHYDGHHQTFVNILDSKL